MLLSFTKFVNSTQLLQLKHQNKRPAIHVNNEQAMQRFPSFKGFQAPSNQPTYIHKLVNSSLSREYVIKSCTIFYQDMGSE